MLTILIKTTTNHLMQKYILLFLLCFGFYLSNSGQSPKKMLETYTEKYPDTRYVVLDKTEIVSVDLIDGKIEITENSNEELFYLDEDAAYLSEDKITFSSFVKLEEYEATTYIPKTGRYKSKKIKDFKVKNEFSSGIFHDDAQSLNFNFDGLQKGGKTKLTYTKKINQPRFLSGFYFIAPVPTINQKYVLEVHPDIDIEFKKFNTENIDYSYTETNKGGKKIYTFSLKNTPKFELEERAPKISYYAPHVVPRITQYKVNGETKKLLESPKDLFAWYNSLIKDVNRDIEDEKLKQLVKEITKGANNELEKVKQIYYWTQNNIKYIAFEEGMEGFVPRNTDKVVNQKYGDCKDMSTCISKLLNYADVDANICWIGTDAIPYTYEEMPTPASDNHMIAAYKNEGKYYFLDATSEFTPFGMPSSFIQGKEAMVKTGDNTFEIAKVPVVAAQKNSKIEYNKLKIVKDKLIGNAQTEIDGYLKTNMNYAISDADKEKQFDFFDRYLNKGSNKFILEDFNLSNLKNKDLATKIDYNYNIDDYLFTNKDEIYINLNLYKFFEGQKLKDGRTIPIIRRFKRYDKITTELEIPVGYTISFLPKDINLQNKLYNYKSKYKKEGNKIIHIEEAAYNFLIMKSNEFEKYNAFLSTVDEYLSQSIILKKK